MLRILYAVLLRLHPKQFQARFGNEMLLTFEEARDTEGTARLVLDAVLSLFRQHFLRTHSKDRLPSQAGQQVVAGAIQLSQPAQFGLGPYRLFQGGLISLALFVTVFLCIRGGKAFRDNRLFAQDGSGAQAQPLRPSDLATIHVECPKATVNACSSPARDTDATPDEMMDLLPPATQKPDAHELLLPSGPFGIGRVLYEWQEDQDITAGRPQARNRFVFVWYPSPAPEGTTKPFASIWNYSRANQQLVQTHTLEKPPIVKGSHLFPVLLFYPSVNSSSAAYTTQIENLVSHGYVVASLEPHTDRSVLSFSNAQLVPFAADLRKAYRARENSSHDSLLQRALDNFLIRQKSLAGDLSFVLDRLTVANSASREIAPFSGRLDLSRVGAFGHSDGGIAAALACRLDSRISLCLSEDGWAPTGPSPEIAEAKTSPKPFMWIDIPLASPETEQLAYLHMKRAEVDSLARKGEILASRQLTSLGKEAYRVTVRLPEVTDSYFTDGPFVWSQVNPQGSVTERNVLVIVNTYARAFFDRYLKGGSKQLLDGSALPLRNVEVKRYGSRPL